MATRIGGLLIDLNANVAALRQDMGKAQRTMAASTRRMQRSMDALRGAAVRVGGALAAAFGVRAIVRQVGAIVDLQDRVLKLSQSTGFAVETLSAYRFVAERSGIQTALLEQGMGAFAKRLGELRADTGSLKTILDKTNPELRRQLETAQSSDAAFRVMLEGLAGIENEADRAALAAAAFSRTAGVEMARLVADGTDELDKLVAKARELGVVFDKKTAEGAAELKDQITDLQSSWTSLLLTIGRIGVYDAIAAGFRKINEAIRLPTGFERYEERIKEVQAQLAKLARVRDALGPVTPASREQIAQVEAQIKALRTQLQFLRGEANEAWDAVRGGGGAPSGGRSMQPPAPAGAKRGAAQTAGQSDERVRAWARAYADAVKSAARLRDQNEANAEFLRQQSRSLEALEGHYRSSANASTRLVENAPLVTPDPEQVRAFAAEFAEAARSAERLAQQQESFRQFGSIVSSGLARAVVHAQDLREAIRGIALQLAEAALRAQIFNAMMAAGGALGAGGSQTGPFGFAHPGQPGGQGTSSPQAAAVGGAKVTADLSRRGF